MPASALVNDPRRSWPPSNLWNVPLKREKPAAVKPSSAKKISRMRARSMSDSRV